MDKRNDPVDDRLSEILSSLLLRYQDSAKKLHLLAPQLNGKDGAGPLNDELRLILNSIESQQANYEQMIELWNAAGNARSEKCKQLKQEVQDRLEQLISQIQSLQDQAQATKSRLLPQLSSAALGQQASAAYQRNNKVS